MTAAERERVKPNSRQGITLAFDIDAFNQPFRHGVKDFSLAPSDSIAHGWMLQSYDGNIDETSFARAAAVGKFIATGGTTVRLNEVVAYYHESGEVYIENSHELLGRITGPGTFERTTIPAKPTDRHAGQGLFEGLSPDTDSGDDDKPLQRTAIPETTMLLPRYDQTTIIADSVDEHHPFFNTMVAKGRFPDIVAGYPTVAGTYTSVGGVIIATFDDNGEVFDLEQKSLGQTGGT